MAVSQPGWANVTINVYWLFHLCRRLPKSQSNAFLGTSSGVGLFVRSKSPKLDKGNCKDMFRLQTGGNSSTPMVCPFQLFISSPHDILQGLAPAWPTMVGYELCRQNNCARFDLLGFGVVWGVRREAVDQNNRVVLDKQPACVAHKTLNRVLCK